MWVFGFFLCKTTWNFKIHEYTGTWWAARLSIVLGLVLLSCFCVLEVSKLSGHRESNNKCVCFCSPVAAVPGFSLPFSLCESLRKALEI